MKELHKFIDFLFSGSIGVEFSFFFNAKLKQRIELNSIDKIEIQNSKESFSSVAAPEISLSNSNYLTFC